MKHQFTENKQVSSSKGEADECLFEYLHGEMINYVINSTPNIENVRIKYML